MIGGGSGGSGGLRAWGYVRVSTRELDEENQKKAIEDFARERGIVIERFFIDKGESGAKPFAERPESMKMLEALAHEKPDMIIAWSIDRIGRNMMDTLNTITKLENMNVKIVTVREEWLQTLDDNIRRLILSVLAWVAEWERRRIRERQEEAWRQGKQKGRPRKLKRETLEKYLRKYPGLNLKAIWKIMRADGYNIGYSTLRKYMKELREKTTA